MSEVAEPLYCGLMNTSLSLGKRTTSDLIMQLIMKITFILLDESSNFADSCGELNLSNQGLKKVTKDLIKSSDIASLVLDHNSLQRIENVDHLTQLICVCLTEFLYAS
jgi:ABC-type lipopolysaccharide export system ATPase subunit